METGLQNDDRFRNDLGKEDPELATILGSMSDWADKEISLSCFIGGLSNQVYKVEIANQPYVVRIPGKNSNLLGGNQKAEINNTISAGGTGVGPRVLKKLEESGGLILEYIEGIPLTAQLLADVRVISSVISALKKLHNGPSFDNTFSMSGLISQFMGTVASHELNLLKGFKSQHGHFDTIRTVLESTSVTLVPCHNDAFPKNWILDKQLNARLIDFEYSGNNDPSFELATLYVEAGWDNLQLQDACRLYYGESFVKESARVWLHSILFDVGWALYAVVRSSIAGSDSSRFIKIALARWERAHRKIDSQDFGLQIAIATH